MTETPPEELSEKELFTEYVQLLKQRGTPASGYEEAKMHEQQARLLAEIGERLEALEAAKSLIGETGGGRESDRRRPDERTNEFQRLSFEEK